MLWFHLFHIFSKKYIKNVLYFCSIFYLQFLFYSHVDVFLLQPCFIYHFFYINVNSIKYIWLLFNFSWIMYNITLWKITCIFILQKNLFFVLIWKFVEYFYQYFFILSIWIFWSIALSPILIWSNIYIFWIKFYNSKEFVNH